MPDEFQDSFSQRLRSQDKFPITDPEEIATALRMVEGWRDQIAATRARIAGAFSELSDIPCAHRWTIITVWRPSAPVHPRILGNASTVVLLKCQICSWPATTVLDGIFSEDTVRGKATE